MLTNAAQQISSAAIWHFRISSAKWNNLSKLFHLSFSTTHSMAAAPNKLDDVAALALNQRPKELKNTAVGIQEATQRLVDEVEKQRHHQRRE
jgi:hypothetical protein